ncbi:unnamed protein product, partial [Cylicostephanus goldi]
MVPTFNASKDYATVMNRKRSLLNFFSSINHAASALRGQREKTEEFARQRPDEQGEFPLLQEISAHWDASELSDLLDEAEILLERLDNEIKLLPTADMLYDRCSSSVISSQTVPNYNVSSASSSSKTIQPPSSPQQLAPDSQVVCSRPPTRQDHPSDSLSVAPVNPTPFVNGAIVPQTGDRCTLPLVGLGIPPSNVSVTPNFSTKTKALPITSNDVVSNPTNVSSKSSTHFSTALEQPIKLPAFEIPSFHGDIDAFPAFWNLYSVAVHNNNSVPLAVKFMYLKSHLKGDAANIIANIQPTPENYENAVRTIVSTYSRPELLRSRLWDKLNQQMPADNTAISQRATLCAIKAIWSQMKYLKEESGSTGALKLIRSKFPRRTREKVGELKKKGDPMWTVDELLTALDTVVDRLEVIEDADPADYSISKSQ